MFSIEQIGKIKGDKTVSGFMSVFGFKLIEPKARIEVHSDIR